MDKCGSGEIRNGTNQCVTAANCHGGQFATGDPTQCGSCGPMHDLIGGQCLDKCGSGEIRNGTNQCVTPANCQGGQYNANNPALCLTCGPGYGLNSAKACVKKADCGIGGQVNPNNVTQCSSCGNGLILSGNSCVAVATVCSEAKSACSSEPGNGRRFWGCVAPKVGETSWSVARNKCS